MHINFHVLKTLQYTINVLNKFYMKYFLYIKNYTHDDGIFWVIYDYFHIYKSC